MEPPAAAGGGEPSRDVEVAEAQALGGYEAFAQTEAADPAGEVVGEHVEREPDGVGGELARRQMVETNAVLEVADGVLDLGVTAVVGFHLEHRARSVGDEGVVPKRHSEKIQLAPRRRPDPAYQWPDPRRLVHVI